MLAHPGPPASLGKDSFSLGSQIGGNPAPTAGVGGTDSGVGPGHFQQPQEAGWAGDPRKPALEGSPAPQRPQPLRSRPLQPTAHASRDKRVLPSGRYLLSLLMFSVNLRQGGAVSTSTASSASLTPRLSADSRGHGSHTPGWPAPLPLSSCPRPRSTPRPHGAPTAVPLHRSTKTGPGAPSHLHEGPLAPPISMRAPWAPHLHKRASEFPPPPRGPPGPPKLQEGPPCRGPHLRALRGSSVSTVLSSG